MAIGANLSQWLAVAVLAVVLFPVYKRVAVYWKSRAFARPPVAAVNTPWWDVFNVNFVLRLIKATNDARLPEYMGGIRGATAERERRRVETFELQFLGAKGIFTVDPKNIQAFLAHQFQDYGLGEYRIGSFLPMLGVGIFASDGKPWEHSRAMLRPNFTREQIADLSLEERHAQDLLHALPDVDGQGWTSEFDIQPLFYKLTMDSATEFFFGESSYSLRQKQRSPETDFVESFDRNQHVLGQRANLGEFYWVLNSAQFRADNKVVHDWTDKRVARALDKWRAKKHAGAQEKSKYVFLEELMEFTQDPIELRSQLLNVLIAGRDTTAGLLSWVFYLLARRPDEYQKIRRTVLETFGTFDEPRDITFASLKACKPLQNLLNETLRLFPGVPFNLRQALKDSTLPRGGGPDGDQPIFVPKDTQVFYSVFLMQRDKELWGPDAEEFVPDRWYNLKTGWEYLPFNGGPRLCLGQQFSLTSAGYAIVRLLQQFDRLDTSDTRAPQVKVSLTAQSANGVYIRMHKA